MSARKYPIEPWKDKIIQGLEKRKENDKMEGEFYTITFHEDETLDLGLIYTFEVDFLSCEIRNKNDLQWKMDDKICYPILELRVGRHLWCIV